MEIYLLVASVIIFACVVLNRISSRLGIPTLLAFIVLGMVFGSDGLFKIPFEDYRFAEEICSIALIFIMFYGGFGTNWKRARPVAASAVMMSTLGVMITAGAVGVFCHFVFKMGWLESFLMGSIISSTDAASVFSILRSKKLNLKHNTASLLEIESGSNDPFSYMLTVIFLAAVNQTAQGWSLAYMIFAQIVYAVLAGILISMGALWMLRNFKFASDGFDIVFVFGVAVVSYAIPEAVGGNGYLSVYIVGIILGNRQIKNKKNMVHFFDGVTGLVQMLIFFLLGLLSFPSRLLNVAFPALLIALFLTFIARPLAVFLLLTPFKCKLSQQIVVSWAGLRGAASIVFAIIVIMSAQPQNDIFHTVFFIVLFSILIQGTLLPYISKKVKMIDENSDVMKTFTDYSEERPIQFIQFSIPQGHSWSGQKLKDIVFPPDTLVVFLKRDGKSIVPNGKSVLEQGDSLILAAPTPEKVEGIKLSEIYIDSQNEYIGKSLSELPDMEDMLIVMIMRKNRTVIPNGRVKIMANDILVISSNTQGK